MKRIAHLSARLCTQRIAALFKPTIILAAVVGLIFAWSPSAQAQTIKYWDYGGTPVTLWSTAANWDTAAGGGGGNPAVVPGASDIAYFNISTLNTAQIATLSADTSMGGLVFNSTGTTAINTDAIANRKITWGTAGLTINSGAGAVTFGTTAANNNITFALGGVQTWANNSANTFTLNNNNTIDLSYYHLTIGGTGILPPAPALLAVKPTAALPRPAPAR